MMLTQEQIEANRLVHRTKRLAMYDIDVHKCSAEEWLKLALDFEQMKIICGPHDPAYEYFSKQQRRYEEAASLKEMIELSRKSTTGG